PSSSSSSSSSTSSSSLTPSTSPVQEGVDGYYRKKDEEEEERGEDTSMLKMEERKLFLGGLPSNCDKQELKDYFSQFGEIEDSIVMMDRVTGRSRGFGFITFLHPQDMEACLDKSPHVVMDKTIDVKRAVEGGLGPRITRHEGPMKDAAWSENNYMGYHYNRGVVAGPGGGYRANTGGKGGGGSSSSSSSSYTLPYRVPDDPKKVFIGGLPPCADNNSLARMLSQYGSVVNCNVMFDRGTGRNRGFGYATFSTPHEANDACHGGDNNVMDGKWVEVKPCTRLEFPTTEGVAAAAASAPKSPSSSAMYGGQQRGEGYRAEQQWRQKEKLFLPDDPCKVFLGGLPQSADQSRVTEHLSQYGHVQEVTVMYDRETGRHRGFAYATFSNNDEAIAAINGNNVIHGKLGLVRYK
ncbi:Ser/Arg-rich splicing factor, putative, partial [Perkinsus marinus ATCC 50983]